MTRSTPFCARVALALGTTLTLLAGTRAPAADLTYSLQPIVSVGGMAGDVPLPKSLSFAIAGLNDRGQVLFDVGTGDGTQPDRLLEYAGGQFTPIMVSGRDGPVGPWPGDVFLFGPSPQSLNEQGDVVFAVHSRRGQPLGVFRWDAASGKAIPVIRKGMPAGEQLAFQDPIDVFPAINGRAEIAVGAPVQNEAGPSGTALFVISPDGKPQSLLLPGGALATGEKLLLKDPQPAIDETGAVLFLARRPNDKQDGVYRWDQGVISPLLTLGTAVPGGGTISSVSRVLANDHDQSVLAAAGANGLSRQGLYRIAAGQLIPLAVPGQPLPGGGRFANLQAVLTDSTGIRCYGVSRASSAGEYVFTAALDDGSTAAYRIAADGGLSVVLKSGMTTPTGKITRVVEASAALNGPGQVALVVRIDNGPDTLVLLTPVEP